MKKLYIFICVTVLLFAFSQTVFAGDGDIDSYKDGFSYDDMISSLDSSVIEVLNEIGITEISYESIFSVTPKKVFDSLYEIFKSSLKEPFKYFLWLLRAICKGYFPLVRLIRWKGAPPSPKITPDEACVFLICP